MPGEPSPLGWAVLFAMLGILALILTFLILDFFNPVSKRIRQIDKAAKEAKRQLRIDPKAKWRDTIRPPQN